MNVTSECSSNCSRWVVYDLVNSAVLTAVKDVRADRGVVDTWPASHYPMRRSKFPFHRRVARRSPQHSTRLALSSDRVRQPIHIADHLIGS